MDATWLDALKTFGLPTCGCIGAGLFFWKFGMWAMKKGDELFAQVGTHIETVTKEVKEINPKLDRIESKLQAGVCKAEEPGRKTVRHA